MVEEKKHLISGKKILSFLEYWCLPVVVTMVLAFFVIIIPFLPPQIQPQSEDLMGVLSDKNEENQFFDSTKIVVGAKETFNFYFDRQNDPYSLNGRWVCSNLNARWVCLQIFTEREIEDLKKEKELEYDVNQFIKPKMEDKNGFKTL